MKYGMVKGKGTPTSDSVKSVYNEGDTVFNANATKHIAKVIKEATGLSIDQYIAGVTQGKPQKVMDAKYSDGESRFSQAAMKRLEPLLQEKLGMSASEINAAYAPKGAQTQIKMETGNLILLQ